MGNRTNDVDFLHRIGALKLCKERKSKGTNIYILTIIPRSHTPTEKEKTIELAHCMNRLFNKKYFPWTG